MIKTIVKPLYNVPPNNLFLPIAFKMFGPGKVPEDQCISYLSITFLNITFSSLITFDSSGRKDDFDLYLPVVLKFVQSNVNLKVGNERKSNKSEDTDRPQGCRAMQSPRLFTTYSYLLSYMLGRRRINHGI